MELSYLHTILKQEGTSQVERYLPALDPSYVKITEQSLLDQLRFAEEYSQFLIYLRADGKNEHLEHQTWKNFFSGDPTTLVARIANHDVTKIKLHYASIYTAFTKTPLVFNFLKLLTYTGIWIIQLDDWLKASKPASLLYRDLSLTIAAELSPKLIKLKEYYLATKVFGPQDRTFEEFFNLGGLEPIWGNLHKITAADQTIFSGNTEEEKLSNAAIYINAIFEAFLKTVGNTVSSGERYLEDSLTNDGTHAPHMALFISFLQIFESGQKQLNALTQRHLDFYYRRFLQIPVRGPVADQATILFTLTKGLQPFPLPALTSLIAGKDDTNKQQTYLTDRELLMTHATVSAIKTIFIDEGSSGFKGVYGAPVAPSADGLGAPFKTDDTSWDLFGSAMPADIAETGFALASPQLYFKEGTRTISLDFQLNAAIVELPTESGQLDPGLFNFYLTSEKGWISTVPLPKAKAGEILVKSLMLTIPGEGEAGPDGSGSAASASVSAGRAGSIPAPGPDTATLTIVLNIPTSTAKAVVGYTEKLHGGHFNTPYPVLKAVINYPPPPAPVLSLIGAPPQPVIAGPGSEAPRGQAVTAAGLASGAPESGTPVGPMVMSRSAIDNAQPGSSSGSPGGQSPGGPGGTTAGGNSANPNWTITDQRNFLQASTIASLTISARAGMLSIDADPDEISGGMGTASTFNPGTASPVAVTAISVPVNTGIGGLYMLQAANDEAEVDTTKPFLPFTAIPRIGSSFYLNAPEFSNKPISNAAIYLEWLLPDNFSAYYQPYGILYNENNFQVNIDLLSAQVYKNEGTYELFDPADSTHLIELNNLDSGTFGAILDAGDQVAQAAIGIRQKEGTLRLSLLKDFGNSIYPQLIVGSLIEKSGKLTLTPEDTADLKAEIDAHPLVFTQDARIKTQLRTLANTQGVPDLQIHSAVSQGIRLHLVKQNLLVQSPAATSASTAAASAGPASSPAAALTPPAAPAIKSVFSHLGQVLTNLVRFGKVSPAAGPTAPLPGTTIQSAQLKTPLINPTVDYVLRKETENHLEMVSHLSAARIMELKAAGPVTEQQIDDAVNQTLADQQPAFQQTITTTAQDLIKILSIPPPPYTPQLKSVQLAYDSSRDFSGQYDTFYHVLPFGVSTQASLGNLCPPFSTPASKPEAVFPANGARSNAAIANAAFLSAASPGSAANAVNASAATPVMQGELLIGLGGIDPGQQLALFFQILDGSNAEFGPPPTITWSYMSQNAWYLLPKDDLIADSTYSFQNKGIIVLDLPKDMTTGTEQHPELNLLWLMASISGAAINLPRISAILPNAVTATFSDQGNSPDHYLQPLPAGTIAKMTSKIAQVATLSQPVATAGGRCAELAPEYFTRVSERLRHKHRAVTNWDYEHLLLQQFPAVYKVKCLNNFFVNRAILDDAGKFIPGHLSLVLVPDLRNQTAAETIPLKPRVAYKTLIDAENYLSKYCPPGVQVHAVNPAFDAVKVSATVKFRTGLDNGSQLKKLNTDLIGFLAPWTVDTSADISFQTKIYASSLLDFIDKLDYVDYVTQFDMYCSNRLEPLVETAASTPFSIMVSAAKHDLTYIA